MAETSPGKSPQASAEPSSEDQSSNQPPKDFRRYAYPALAVILAVLVIWGLSHLNSNTQDDTRNIVSQKQVDLPEEGRQALEAHLAELEQQATALPPEASAEERFRVYFDMAQTKYQLGRYADAVADLDKVAGDNQNNPGLWGLYAQIYQDMGDAAKARDSAKRALDLDNKNPRAWLLYISTQTDQSADTVKGFYQDALQSTDNNIGIVTAYAKFLESTGDKQGAIDQWRKAIEIFPQGKADYEAEIARLQA